MAEPATEPALTRLDARHTETRMAAAEVAETVVAMQFGQLIVHAALIRAITGEWLYRGVQPTLLFQPSRKRHLLAQAAVAAVLCLGCAALQLFLTFLIGPIAAAHSGVPFLLGEHIGWMIAICILGSLLGMLAAFTVSLLMLNPAGALAAYFASAPLMVILASLVPRLFAWVSPFTPVAELSTLDDYAAPLPAMTSLGLWAALLLAAAYRVARHDVE